MVLPPTAMHAVGEAHETPAKPVPVVLGPCGRSWIDQWRPSQRSARGIVAPVASRADPTATQVVGDPQDTAAICPLGAVGGGMG
jgi:hypothetical protein